jgi:hypothetical protein
MPGSSGNDSPHIDVQGRGLAIYQARFHKPFAPVAPAEAAGLELFCGDGRVGRPVAGAIGLAEKRWTAVAANLQPGWPVRV